jgi:putative sterol carrier protein
VSDAVREFFESLPGRLDPEATRGQRATYRFEVDGAGNWIVAVDDGSVDVREGDGEADVTIAASEKTFLGLVRGEQSPVTAFMTGKVKVSGDMSLAMRLRDLF